MSLQLVRRSPEAGREGRRSPARNGDASSWAPTRRSGGPTFPRLPRSSTATFIPGSTWFITAIRANSSTTSTSKPECDRRNHPELSESRSNLRSSRRKPRVLGERLKRPASIVDKPVVADRVGGTNQNVAGSFVLDGSAGAACGLARTTRPRRADHQSKSSVYSTLFQRRRVTTRP